MRINIGLVVPNNRLRMRTVQIDSVEVDSAQRLLVRPRLSPGEDFAFIYRTPTGVRWDSVARALAPVAGSAPAHQDWFKRIVDAVRDEYGCALVAASETQWINVSAHLRRLRSIMTLPSKPSGTKRPDFIARYFLRRLAMAHRDSPTRKPSIQYTNALVETILMFVGLP